MEKHYNVSWRVTDWSDCDPYNKGYGTKTINRTVRTRKEFVAALSEFKKCNDKRGEVSIMEVKQRYVSPEQVKLK